MQVEKVIDIKTEEGKQLWKDTHPANRRLRMKDKEWVYSIMKDVEPLSGLKINTVADTSVEESNERISETAGWYS